MGLNSQRKKDHWVRLREPRDNVIQKELFLNSKYQLQIWLWLYRYTYNGIQKERCKLNLLSRYSFLKDISKKNGLLSMVVVFFFLFEICK